MRAALIYQHATSERDREIAEGMNRRIAKQRSKKEAERTSGRKSRARRSNPDDGAAGLARVEVMAREWPDGQQEIKKRDRAALGNRP